MSDTNLTSSENSALLNSSGRSRRPLVYAAINTAPDDEVRARSAAVLSRYKYYNRLAPHAASPMLMPDHILPPEVWTHNPIPQKGKQNSLVTIFSIWNTMMGTSLLSMPWAVGQSGFILGIILLILMAALTLYTSYRVMKSVECLDGSKGDVLEFSDVCRYYLGRVGEYTAVTFSVIGLLGGAIVYWVLMSNFLYNTVLFIYNEASNTSQVITNISWYHDEYIQCTKSFSDNSSLHSCYNQRDNRPKLQLFDTNATTSALSTSYTLLEEFWDIQKTVPFFLLLVLVPLINFKSATFFTKFNSLGTVSVLYLISFITYKAVIWGVHMDFKQVSGTYAAPMFPALTGVLALAYFIHSCVLSIVRNQAKPQNNGRDLTIAFICVAITYTFVGCLFYATWPMRSKECIDENLLNNFHTADPLAFVARIFLFIQMVTVFPLLLYIMRVQVMHVMFGSIWPSWKHVVILNLLVVGVCLIFARFLPQIGQIIRFAGAFCGLVYAFFLPCTTYILQQKERQKLTKISLIFHIFLIVLGLANFIAQFLILK